jgi:hypothetical protein
MVGHIVTVMSMEGDRMISNRWVHSDPAGTSSPNTPFIRYVIVMTEKELNLGTDFGVGF